MPYHRKSQNQKLEMNFVARNLNYEFGNRVKSHQNDGFVKAVTPVKTGVQRNYTYLKKLDSGFRRNDGKPHFRTFYETIKFDNLDLRRGACR
jgi:hypothetical protein